MPERSCKGDRPGDRLVIRFAVCLAEAQVEHTASTLPFGLARNQPLVDRIAEDLAAAGVESLARGVRRVASRLRLAQIRQLGPRRGG